MSVTDTSRCLSKIFKVILFKQQNNVDVAVDLLMWSGKVVGKEGLRGRGVGEWAMVGKGNIQRHRRVTG